MYVPPSPRYVCNIEDNKIAGGMVAVAVFVCKLAMDQLLHACVSLLYLNACKIV